jgi:hypothetical protein
VFSNAPLTLENIPPPLDYIIKSEWRKAGDLDTTGGALKTTQPDGTVVDNSKWCQNPQFHLEIADSYGKDEIHLKIVLRRTDKGSRQTQGFKAAKDSNDKGKDVFCGLVISKADVLIDDLSKVKKRQPRQNKFGEVS